MAVGHGVDPEIVVDNLPHATFNGSDAQLDAAARLIESQQGFQIRTGAAWRYNLFLLEFFHRLENRVADHRKNLWTNLVHRVLRRMPVGCGL